MTNEHTTMLRRVSRGARGKLSFGLAARRLLQMLDTPDDIERALAVLRLIETDMGHRRSAVEKMPVDQGGAPLPWFTYPAIEYLKQFDYSALSAFEYSCGNGSRFWASRMKEIVSVEHDGAWFARMETERMANQRLVHRAEPAEYTRAIGEFGKNFDVVIIDGEWRRECAQECLGHIAPEHMIIVDNSDWFPATCEFLRSREHVQIDFSGMGPINYYTWTTSIFFTGGFRLNAVSGRQPVYAVGALQQTGPE